MVRCDAVVDNMNEEVLRLGRLNGHYHDVDQGDVNGAVLAKWTKKCCALGDSMTTIN